MKNIYFGEMIFNTGWKSLIDIKLFDKITKITVKAKAYFEKDGVTSEQEAAFSDFNNNKAQRLKNTELLLSDYAGDIAMSRFEPKTLLFERDGSYCILFDDHQDEDNGIVVCLIPEEKVLTQDDYL
ncbi:MAG: hypothetical protein KJ774_06035 [Firmicutes bacterium]|nr:hypothetical protein [Bacillota bacterium]